MADQKVGVDFELRMPNAKASMDDLAAATRQGVDALDAAGKSTKTLGQDMAATRNQGKELAEMQRRANAALRENIDTLKVHGAGSKQAAESQKRLNAAQEEVKKAAAAQAQAIEKNTKAVTELAQAEDGKLTPATKRVQAQMARMASEADKAAGDVRRLDLQIALAAKTADKGGKSMSGFMASFAGNLAAGAVGMLASALKQGAQWALHTGAAYETLRIALETTTGSASKAASEFARLQAFAERTPFGVEEVTGAFIKLANRGITPTDRALTSFGNTASAMGKSLDMYVEAVADAITGENERLKEFGIVGKKAGDQIMYTFRGVTTAVKFDAASITEYLTKIGEQNFAGGMEKQSQSLAGMWSTLVDKASALADSFIQGLSPALKDIMAMFDSGDGSGKELAKTLGELLGTALKDLAQSLKDLAPTLIMVGKAATWVLKELSGAEMRANMDEAIAAQRIYGRELGVAEQRLSTYARTHEGAIGTMGRWVSETLLASDAQQRLNEAILIGKKIAYGKSIEDAREAAGASARTREENSRLADMTAKRENASKRAKEAELGALMSDKSLTPSEKKRRNELAKELDVAIPGKKGKAAAKKDPNKLAMDQMDFNSEISSYAAGQNKEARQDALKAQEEAFTAETGMREKRLADMDKELALADELADKNNGQLDLIFYVRDVETEEEKRRDEMFARRLEREQELADWQLKNAQTQAQREEAQTRLIDVQTKKRLAAVEKASESERKEVARKQSVYQKFTGIYSDLASLTVQASWEAAEGQKGALASALGDYLKSVSKMMAVKGAVELAMGVAAAAGIVTAGLAPGHFAAAGMAFAAAAAAGGAGVAASAIGSAQAGSGKKGGAGQSIDEGAFPDGRPGIPSTGGNGNGHGQGSKPADEGRKLEPLDHPISYDEARRGGKSQAAQGAGVTIHVGTFVGGGSPKEAAQALQKLLDENKSAGKRY